MTAGVGEWGGVGVGDIWGALRLACWAEGGPKTPRQPLALRPCLPGVSGAESALQGA